MRRAFVRAQGAGIALAALTLATGCETSEPRAADASLSAGDAQGEVPDAGGLTSEDAATTERDASSPVEAEAGSAADADVPQDGSSLPTKKCVVFLHGKSGSGFASEQRGGYLLVGPTGNADGWGGKQWLYFPEAGYQQVRTIVQSAIAQNGCTQLVVHGFSNGAAAAAKLYCRGESFGGAVVGYVVDDPVPDHGADGCAPAAGVKVRLYWTGGLSPADGWNCQEGDWTCEGGETIGIQKYAARLGTQRVQSVQNQHAPYDSPPEYEDWL